MTYEKKSTRLLTAKVVIFYIALAFSVATLPSTAYARSHGGIIRSGTVLSRTLLANRINVSNVTISPCLCTPTVTTIEIENTGTVISEESAHAESGSNTARGGSKYMGDTTVTLRELGILQLAAHDFFNVDRDTGIDHENGKLDLSTLLDHGDEYIAIGGEPRNRENILLFTVASEYGGKYIDLIEDGKTAEDAHENILDAYHDELEEVFKKLFTVDMPKPEEGSATMTENLAFRIIHDFLPGTIIKDGHVIETVDPSLVGQKLSRRELKQQSDPLDGTFNEVFRDVEIHIPPDTVLHIDLLERDSSFATQFSTAFSFEHFLDEVADGHFDHGEDVQGLIYHLFAKGLNF